MATITITLPDEEKERLEKRAEAMGVPLENLILEQITHMLAPPPTVESILSRARSGKTMTAEQVQTLVDTARANAGLDEDEAMELAVREVLAHRRGE